MLTSRAAETEGSELPTTLRIGQLAKLASVHVETLRYYEREGLLEKPYQHLSGYRAYPVSAVAHVQSIKRAQALGFSLAEIRTLLKGARGARFSTQAARKLAEIDGVIVDLQRARADLLRLVEYGCDGLVGCSCGRADCPTNAAVPDLAPAPPPDLGSGSKAAKPPGLLAGALLAAGCAACCAPLVGTALAAIGVPALAAAEGVEVAMGATVLTVGGIALNRLRRRKAGTQVAASGVSPQAIACSLSKADLGDRQVEWRALLDSSLERSERIPSGVRLTVQPSASGELKRLIDLERGCCAWMRFEFESPETVAITASGEGADVLVAMFLNRDQDGC